MYAHLISLTVLNVPITNPAACSPVQAASATVSGVIITEEAPVLQIISLASAARLELCGHTKRHPCYYFVSCYYIQSPCSGLRLNMPARISQASWICQSWCAQRPSPHSLGFRQGCRVQLLPTESSRHLELTIHLSSRTCAGLQLPISFCETFGYEQIPTAIL